ncbi:hypothetical protein SAMN05421839_10573 [Halolactibacillus halophilus]|uniref:Uncharacterized protein n=1 Tax=Halolactibacillus halophilus TaxID=306540 RepID=A0A1I5MG10_9BACI|nr:hypothetical protein [Halolactibacillus halophilus]GEM02198.1 hypothetical protein HHA03_17300 [Halolactibacillus halophilus]SFP08525.1 hypothetical protein SAMN05421839_10573 [Halolactibacillus halophilus]
MSNNEIIRKIHFFRFEISELQPGTNNFQRHSNPKEVFKNIAELELKGDHERSRFKYYLNNDVSFLIDTNISADSIQGRFAISRRSALPEIETAGVLKPLEIPMNSGLAEIIHFIYYPADDVLGVEFNFFGPRATGLSAYLREKSRHSSNPFEFIKLNPILNQDLDTLLQDVGEINFFQMEISRNDLSVLENLDRDLYSAFESAANVSDAESVEVILRKKKYSRGGFPLPFSKSSLKDLLSTSDNRQKINRMKVDAESLSEKNNKTFDLLEDKMITSKKVTTIGERSRSVDFESMFERINEAYLELKGNF